MGYVLTIMLILLLLVIGGSMIARYVIRRRIARATEQLPPDALLTGTALLVGTSFDSGLRGLGALAVTRDQLVWVAGSDARTITVPRNRLEARPHRSRKRQRAASLRVEWEGKVAQFEVDSPSVDDWLAKLS